MVRAELDVARSKQSVYSHKMKKSNRDHEKLAKRHKEYRPTVDPDRGE